jgi:predicted dehydrogenase
VAQDVITEPVKKRVQIQFTKGFLKILINGWENGDLLRYTHAKANSVEEKILKSRPDDFFAEILHIREILENRVLACESPISLERGLNTMRVLHAAHLSQQERKAIRIDYRR